jgi:CRISPR-associated protein Csd2
MCKTFFDVRAFGGVMSTGRGDDSDGDVEAVEGRGEPTEKKGGKGKKAGRTSLSCGKVHGPVQITFAESIDPVQIERNAITRAARVNEEEREGGAGKMGMKYTIPYALYRFKGTITPPYAKLSGFNDADLVVLVEAIKNMYSFDASSARPEMGVVGFYLFKHSSQLGNCPPIRVFNSVQVSRHAEEATPARAYSDYEVALPAAGSLGKKGLTMTVMVHEWDSSKEGTTIEL